MLAVPAAFFILTVIPVAEQSEEVKSTDGDHFERKSYTLR
jgi:hypothetical protein